ncbi:MAG TPA: UpxY family transcription antiterminator [Candidatus Acidoferrum sp.]|nr:UpxY family transcription antiterminator [Candidatus Acidoferrum sp.]HTW22334.1 UpxY family transcription antiterminator [Candidatus Baltobacteraceae bacterium]
MQTNAGAAEAREWPTSACWYAVYTKHQHEKKCADLLQRKSVEAYLPLYQSVRRWQDRKKIIALPLFPSYIFVRSTLETRLEILSTPGVFFIVGVAGRACPIPDQDIESMRTMTNSRARIEPHPYLKSGEHVRIFRGPLSGVQGILSRASNKDRVVLCVEPLQKAVSVEVDLADVEKVAR